MSKLLLAICLTVLFAFSASAQSATASSSGASADKPAKAKRGPVFRATKSQIKEAQKILKDSKFYAGESSGSLDDTTRASIKSFQGDKGLKKTGTLNRATLEAMKIELTNSQKAIPASPSSYAKAGDKSTAGGPAKRTIFRASKDQIAEAQKMMKSKGMYAGDESGKLDDATRAGLKKYQTGNGLKATGTLNQVTLEKMGITLTDKQKAASINK